MVVVAMMLISRLDWVDCSIFGPLGLGTGVCSGIGIVLSSRYVNGRVQPCVLVVTFVCWREHNGRPGETGRGLKRRG